MDPATTACLAGIFVYQVGTFIVNIYDWWHTPHLPPQTRI